MTIPVIYLPSVTDSLPDLPSADTSGDDFGLGDINFSAYFSPVSKGSFTWGIGPSLTLRTATSGSSRHAEMERRAGGGCARDEVNQTLVQPFVNYNMANDWYLVTSPVITVNWEADRDNATMLPVGGGVGRVFTVGTQALNAQVQGFYNAVRPDFAPQASLRLQLAFLFPN